MNKGMNTKMDQKVKGITMTTKKLPIKANQDFGFSIDYGITDVKVAYIKDELHLVSFCKSQVPDAINFLKEHCAEQLRPGFKYYMTGVCPEKITKDFESALDIKLIVSPNHESMINGFVFLTKTHSMQSMVHPANIELRQTAGGTAKAPASAWPDWYPPERCGLWIWNDASITCTSDNKLQFPILLCLVASNHFMFKVEADGKFKLLDFYTICGRTFQGLAKLLIGVQSYEEVLSLASRGNANELDQNMGNLGGNEEDDTYKLLNQLTTKSFSFGFAASDKKKSNFKKEDIAAALVSMIANSVAQDAFNGSILENISQVCFAGEIPSNSELFRREIEKEFFEKSHANIKGHTANCLFVKDGDHLSALGPLLQHLE